MTTDNSTANGAQLPSCLSVALDYIAAGINVTVVSSPKSGQKDAGKTPTLPGWQKTRLTAEAFREAYEKRKNQNIGVVTGAVSGLICVDLDGPEGSAWFTEHEMKLGRFVTERRGASTHLYYKHPGNGVYVPSKIRLFPGVDILADGGKQVVTWPSTHRSGEQYAIENGLTLIDVQHEADVLPQWILDELAAYEAQKKTKSTTPTEQVFSTNQANVQQCIEALLTIPEGIKGQGRDNRTYFAAATCADFGMPKSMAVELLMKHYNPRCKPPKSLEDIEEKVDHAYKYRKEPVGNKAVETIFNEEVPPSTLAAIEQVEEEKKLKGKYVLAKPIQCARRYIKKYPQQVLCDQNQIHTYNHVKHCWEMVDDDLFESILLRDVNDESPSLAEKVKIDQLRTFRIGVKRELEGLFRHIKPDSWLTTGTKGEYVSCSNGILDITRGTIEPHSPEWFSFTTLPFAYNPEAKCPVFQSFLDSVWDTDEDLKRALQLWMGYILISPMNDQKFAILIGESRGGKSTLARVMEAMVGKNNTIGCDMMQFGDVFGLEPVIGKKLAVFSEVEKSSGKELVIATERIKRITGKDPITVNRKNKGMVDTFFTTKIVLICNTIPPFINSSSSLTNRMIAFPFTKTFYGREDRDLDAKLEAELPGIFNWALEGARALLNGERLLQSEAGARKVDEISEVLDNVRGFISDAVKFSEELHAFVSCKTIFETYNRWCKESNYMPHGKKRFFQEFKGKTGNKVSPGTKKEGLTSVRGYYGLKLDEEFLAGHEFSAIENAKNDEDDMIPF